MKRLLFLCLMVLSVFGFAKDDKTIKVMSAGYPMSKIVEIAAEELKKEGYTVTNTVNGDYVTPNIALNSKDIDANLHQHEPFMQVFNQKNKGTLVKVASVYNVYVGFYSKNLKSVKDIKDGMKIAIPNDPTNQDRALRMLAHEGLIKLNPTDGLYSLKDVVNPRNFVFMAVPIPSLVQAYQEADLAFNWPAHMIKIGKTPKDALFLEKGDTKKYAVSLVAREDNKDSKKIQALKKAMQSKAVKEFLEKNYGQEGYPEF